MHIFDGKIEETIATELDDLVKAKELTIYDNEASIEQINQVLKKCINLTRLEISSDTILEVPDLSSCPELFFFKIVNYKLPELKGTFPSQNKISAINISAYIDTLSIDFAELPHLTTCAISGFKLKDYSFLDTLSSALVTLHIQGSTPWANCTDISRFKNLKNLIIDGCTDEKFPNAFSEEAPLRRLRIKKSKFRNINETFKNCKNLNSVIIESVPKLSFTETLDTFPGTEDLWLTNVKLLDADKVPEKTNTIEHLHLDNNDIEIKNLDFLAKCSNLDGLRIHNNTFESPLLLIQGKGLKLHFPGTELFPGLKYDDLDQFLAICKAIAKSKLDQETKEFFVLYLYERKKITFPAKWDWLNLLKATNISHPTFRTSLNNRIDEIIDKQEEIKFDEKSVIYISGKPKAKKGELKKQIEELGAKLVAKYSDEVTHVMIGTNSPDADLLVDKEFVAIRDTHVLKAFSNTQEQYLKDELGTESGGAMLDNLEQLLRSKDPTNVGLAVEMIKTGGLPDKLFEPLLVINKTTESSKIRKDTKTLLELHAPKEWNAIIQNRLSFKAVNDPNKSEMAIRRQFGALAKKVKPAEVAKFAQLMFRNTGRGLRYPLTAGLAKAVKKETYSYLYKDNHFDFSKGLGFTKKMSKDFFDDHVVLESSVSLPVLALELGTIHSLNLKNCRYESIGEKITQFKDLKRLDYSANYLSSIPSHFTELKHLEHLDLSDNSFDKFPILLCHLPKLKFLDLRDNELTEVPASFKKSNPDCEVLLDK